jgi:hypothetical protein
MTTGHTFAFPQRISPGSCMSLPSQERGRRECRVFGCTRSPVCKCRKHTSVVTADEAETSTFPARWPYSLLRAHLGETGPCCLRRHAALGVSSPKGRHRDHHEAWHLPLGRRACTPLPYARMSLVWRHARVHRIPRSTSGDDWPNAPLQSRRDIARIITIFRKTEERIFFS